MPDIIFAIPFHFVQEICILNTNILNSRKIGVSYRQNPYSTLEEGKVCCKILTTHI